MGRVPPPGTCNFTTNRRVPHQHLPSAKSTCTSSRQEHIRTRVLISQTMTSRRRLTPAKVCHKTALTCGGANAPSVLPGGHCAACGRAEILWRCSGTYPKRLLVCARLTLGPPSLPRDAGTTQKTSLLRLSKSLQIRLCVL